MDFNKDLQELMAKHLPAQLAGELKKELEELPKLRKELVKEKGGDLVNYYLIYRALRGGYVKVKVDEWLTELSRSKARPWYLGYELLTRV